MVVQGDPDPTRNSTSYVERQNLSMQKGTRRLTHLTNASSKRIEKHTAIIALYFLHYNFCRVHETLRCTPAMEVGLDTDRSESGVDRRPD